MRETTTSIEYLEDPLLGIVGFFITVWVDMLVWLVKRFWIVLVFYEIIAIIILWFLFHPY